MLIISINIYNLIAKEMANLLHSAKYYELHKELELATQLLFANYNEYLKTKEEKFYKLAEQFQERVRVLNKEVKEMEANA